MSAEPAILILGANSLETARRVQAILPDARIHGLAARVSGADVTFDDFGDTLRNLYRAGHPLVVLCAAGIVIRALASLLQDKGAEPPVLAVAEDGSAVVPLLGGLSGVNVLARRIAAALAVAPAITTTGELRFGTCLLNPPPGFRLANMADGKTFIADLLAGATMRIAGEAPWLREAKLPLDDAGKLVASVTTEARAAQTNELLFRPAVIAVAVRRGGGDLVARIDAALATARLARESLALLLVPDNSIADRDIASAAAAFEIPLRMAGDSQHPEPAARHAGDGIELLVFAHPADLAGLGRRRGRLSVIGLGPGDPLMMIPAARAALDAAEDIVGYETYVRMARPLRADQVVHASDNREELWRARQAFDLAAQGRRVAVVSSGDPGVFAMAAAVLEALDGSDDPAWRAVELEVLPGVSAALAAAAKAGAPLGHDFCLISLSDNLKPWSVITDRLAHAAEGDFAMAFYNPISKARPWQLGEAIEILRRHRAPATPVVLGRDIGRPAESLRVTSLGELRPEMVDMRTVVIVGSSTTRLVARPDGGSWVYTPRWYGNEPAKKQA
ncbi:cobalt-precorrin 5A hydrolase/precorrin-3B C17-methyltransferase [Dongia mobilis]|uniref:Cobalt-precorrin 5A hydrolase/precorrin-3B C17-methyltransferase n=1 Tax=Dongia mobilis TaxID=578943 RepID=A0A4R6WSJ6_9PROT|nr:precorrin-3B C(17)-methyltransferase [Dongia mobilis]TDQ84585.1 cobalt-precorrin 5A hydrolase/precorrin-3B C17-methyltransferase [Dongia mobilis]